MEEKTISILSAIYNVTVDYQMGRIPIEVATILLIEVQGGRI